MPGHLRIQIRPSQCIAGKYKFETRLDYFLVHGETRKVQPSSWNFALPNNVISKAGLTSMRVFGIVDNAILLFKNQGIKPSPNRS